MTLSSPVRLKSKPTLRLTEFSRQKFLHKACDFLAKILCRLIKMCICIYGKHLDIASYSNMHPQKIYLRMQRTLNHYKTKRNEKEKRKRRQERKKKRKKERKREEKKERKEKILSKKKKERNIKERRKRQRKGEQKERMAEQNRAKEKDYYLRNWQSKNSIKNCKFNFMLSYLKRSFQATCTVIQGMTQELV